MQVHVAVMVCINGPMRGLSPETFLVAVGQYELIGKVSAFASQANANIWLNSHLAD